jgi:WS/DGAT C-terminal domain
MPSHVEYPYHVAIFGSGPSVLRRSTVEGRRHVRRYRHSDRHAGDAAHPMGSGALRRRGASVVPRRTLTFNLCVSNVPEPREPLYLNGSRLDTDSILYPYQSHGMALNITLDGYADALNFGFVGRSETPPPPAKARHLHRRRPRST